MKPGRECGARVFVVTTAALWGLLSIAGCGSGPGGHRPVVTQTAAEAAAPPSAGAGSASAQMLNFLDELESRPLVAHDDVLEAALFLGTGQGGTSFDQRVSAAIRLGYVDLGYNQPAHEAATVSEASQTLVRVVRGGAFVAANEAMGEMIGWGAVPPEAKPYQGLTGAQLVSMLGAARDAMKATGAQRSGWPTEGSAPVAASTTTYAAPEVVPVPVESRAQARPAGAKGRPEPLPDVPLVDDGRSTQGAAAASAAPVPLPGATASPSAPAGQPATPGPAVSLPETASSKPGEKAWIRARPLNKPNPESAAPPKNP